jgi:hypothetical protein
MGFTRHAGGRPANRSWWRGPLRRSTGTCDRSVGLSLFTLQITYKIEADIDVERDHAVATMRQSCKVGVELIRDFSTGYHSRNGGGDVIRTDGDLPIIDVRQVSAEARPRSSKPTAGTTVRRRSWSEPPSPPCALHHPACGHGARGGCQDSHPTQRQKGWPAGSRKTRNVVPGWC